MDSLLLERNRKHAGGTPWDVVRLLVGIPLLLISFVMYLQGSLRGTVLFIGSLASFLYQYLLWTFDWAYNSLFLAYVALFSLSLWSLVLVLAEVDGARVKAAISERFPTKTAASFSFGREAPPARTDGRPTRGDRSGRTGRRARRAAVPLSAVFGNDPGSLASSPQRSKVLSGSLERSAISGTEDCMRKAISYCAIRASVSGLPIFSYWI